jgi:hypothetical protein
MRYTTHGATTSSVISSRLRYSNRSLQLTQYAEALHTQLPREPGSPCIGIHSKQPLREVTALADAIIAYVTVADTMVAKLYVTVADTMVAKGGGSAASIWYLQNVAEGCRS